MRTVNVALASIDVSVASTNSLPVDMQSVFAASIQAVVTGSSPTGTLKVQASNDVCTANNAATTFTPANWTDVTGLTVSISAVGSVIIPKFDCAYRWIRVVYTKTSGTGAVVPQVFALAY